MMTIETYAHVHHIVSNISGRKKENILPGDNKISFSGGTITMLSKSKMYGNIGTIGKTG